MTEKDECCFFALLRAGLWNKEVDLSPFDHPVDWQVLMEHGRKQTVLGVLADGIGRLPSVMSPPLPIRRKLQRELLQIRQGHIMLNHVLHEVWKKLTDAGISPILLKGQGVAQNYIYPEQRQCGDIDLYVGSEEYDATCRIMEAYGTVDGMEGESFLHRHFHRNGIVIEIHRIAAYMSDPFSNKHFQQLTRSWLHDGKSNCVKLKGSDILVPPANFDALFLFYHFLRHFIHGGIGLRQVCDWVLCLHARKNEIDRERLLREVRFLRMEKFWQLFGCIAVEYLGLPEDEFPGFIPFKQKRVKRAIHLILEAGNFGHYFYDARQRPKSYYRGKLFALYYHILWQTKVLPFDPWVLLRGGLVNFWKSMKVALAHK